MGGEGEEGGRRVVVAALGRCSRPDRLRPFLYLDFIDREKRQHVLQKLVQTICKCISNFQGQKQVAKNFFLTQNVVVYLRLVGQGSF